MAYLKFNLPTIVCDDMGPDYVLNGSDLYVGNPKAQLPNLDGVEQIRVSEIEHIPEMLKYGKKVIIEITDDFDNDGDGDYYDPPVLAESARKLREEYGISEDRITCKTHFDDRYPGFIMYNLQGTYSHRCYRFTIHP